MKRTTISVPEDLLRRARRVADQRRVSLGEVLRDALRVYLEGGGAWDPPRSLGFADSGGAARGREFSDLPDSAYGRGPS
jgi:Arc/MetJ-type ribon-helix-helix transcriptional regulator